MKKDKLTAEQRRFWLRVLKPFCIALDLMLLCAVGYIFYINWIFGIAVGYVLLKVWKKQEGYLVWRKIT